MCANSDGGSLNTYGARYYWNRTWPIPDVELRYANVSYTQGLYQSSSFLIASDRTYYVKSSWSAVPSAPNDYEGYVSTRYVGSACS
jgi:hypothetical protein